MEALADVQLIPLREVVRIAGISRSEVWRRVNAKTFPAPIKLGDHCTRWEKNEVTSWVAVRLAARKDSSAEITPRPLAA
jgi:prophage regulatory protein